ncbi:thioesterase II family protein [Actinoplanes sp. HUAS TT8]|uniref:thioesterase II family protein n=1 Tax=Actinoplanes sp. HUAS TT8 TaxID=3447453 RepID=UPI003F527BCA
MFGADSDAPSVGSSVRVLAGGPRLICFPHAGATAAVFAPLARALTGWRVDAIDPPGHGANRRPLARDFDELVAAYAEAYAAAVDGDAGPVVLLGHSLGGLAAFRLTQLLEADGVPPSALVLSGTSPPDDEPGLGWHEMEQSELVGELARWGSLPPELLADPEFVAYLTSLLRADARVADSCRLSASPLVNTPAYLLAGDADPLAAPASVRRWQSYLRRSEFQVLPGDHMFLLTHLDRTVPVLRSIANRVGSGRSAPAGP